MFKINSFNFQQYCSCSAVQSLFFLCLDLTTSQVGDDEFII